MLGLFLKLIFTTEYPQEKENSLTGIERWPFKPEDSSSSLVGYTTVSWQIGDATDCLSVPRGFDSLRHRHKIRDLSK